MSRGNGGTSTQGRLPVGSDPDAETQKVSGGGALASRGLKRELHSWCPGEGVCMFPEPGHGVCRDRVRD